MYEGVVFFAGPKTRWLGKVHRDEVIARVRAPWLWLARWALMGTWRTLDRSRCGYALLENGSCVEKFDPEPQ